MYVNALESKSNRIRSDFKKLPDSLQVEELQTFGLLPCLKDFSLYIGIDERFYCPACDSQCIKILERNSQWLAYLDVLTELTSVSAINQNERLRVTLMRCVFRFLRHYRIVSVVDSPIEHWIVAMLRSRFRECRIAATRVLPLLIDSPPSNKYRVFKIISDLSSLPDLYITETIIQAWSEIGKLTEGDDLNFVLMKLLFFLDSSNSFHAAMAFHEIKMLAASRNKSPWRLIAQFWSVISVFVFKEYGLNSRMVGTVANLLEVPVDNILLRTQEFTLPYLILAKKTDVLKRLADAQSKSLSQVCKENMSSILAVLLTQDLDNPVRNCVELLAEVTDDTNALTSIDLFSFELSVAVEILKMYNEDDELKADDEIPLFRALNIIAKQNTKDSRSTRSQKFAQSSSLDKFFKKNILGVISQLSDMLYNVHRKLQWTEKVKCLRGIAAAVRFANKYAVAAIPQICSCLQSALDDPVLQDAALFAWTYMIRYFDEKEVSSLLLITVSVIFNNWNNFTSKSRTAARGMLDIIINSHSSVLATLKVAELPSRPSFIPELRGQITKLVSHLKEVDTTAEKLVSFTRRCRHENFAVVHEALLELRMCLIENQLSFYSSPELSSPDNLIYSLMTTLLSVCHRFSSTKKEIVRLASECLGLIGALDPTKIEDKSDKQDILLHYNFESKKENINFVLVFLEMYVVPAFRASTETKPQLFLAFAMQELLHYCGLDVKSIATPKRPDLLSSWHHLSQVAKATLTPFLESKYSIGRNIPYLAQDYPIYPRIKRHRSWVQTFLFDLLKIASEIQKAKGAFRDDIDIFYVFGKIINNQDLSISSFLLPFIVQFVLANGTDENCKAILDELLAVLHTDSTEHEDVRLSYYTVFSILDYGSRWQRAQKSRANDRSKSNDDLVIKAPMFLESIPVELIGNRALESQSYARALYYFEQHSREIQHTEEDTQIVTLYQKLQQVYAKIGDPDAVQGMSTLILSNDLEQQIVEHEAAGEWELAQSCYEIQLESSPDDNELHSRLLNCLRESHNFDNLLNRLKILCQANKELPKRWVDLGVEASWMLGNWNELESWLQKSTTSTFNVSVGRALHHIRNGNLIEFYSTLSHARIDAANEIAFASITSAKSGHGLLLRLHALADIETLVLASLKGSVNYTNISIYFEQRMLALGASYQDNRFLLDLRRAVVNLVESPFANEDNLLVYLTEAKLARKSEKLDEAFLFALKASRRGSPLALIEQARLQWNQGRHRQAVKMIEDIIHSKALDDFKTTLAPDTQLASQKHSKDNITKAKAVLLYAKWIDRSDQSDWSTVLHNYKLVSSTCESLESGHYYTGRYFLKIIEAQMMLPLSKQNRTFIIGEYHRNVCRFYCKAVKNGVKYVYHTLPKLLTLWLDFDESVDPQVSNRTSEVKDITKKRKENLSKMTVMIGKYFESMPSYQFFPVLSQIISRICHTNKDIYKVLRHILAKVAVDYPAQSLWSILAISHSEDKLRRSRGDEILRYIQTIAPDLGENVLRSRKLTDMLVEVCTMPVPSKTTRRLDLSRLNFSCLPSSLVVPIQKNFTISWPSKWVAATRHRAFSSSPVTILNIEKRADVMNSLQMPRRITVMGSDGNEYFFLCKPKDDLRKDARLMEFNTMINMLLRKDTESAKRNLDIVTYAVTPLSENCGLIEWVTSTKTVRDILSVRYSARNIRMNLAEVRAVWNDPKIKKTEGFASVVKMFPPVLYEWFIDTFPVPSTWLSSRTSYARTNAVMAMIGYIVGLGDRHCENILLHEATGNLMHVDFSCLFEKGLDLEIPERVPFRLTQNLVDALGPYGYEGPFRRCCELALQILRVNEELLTPVLETFLHDPVMEFKQHRSGRKGSAASPEEALLRISRRLRGLISDDTLFPLSIDGQVDVLIKQATDVRNLSEMYIGWLPMW
ncbi:hypothetical protein V1511DRAFT_456314 [Dipodascopsis uninucleata]